MQLLFGFVKWKICSFVGTAIAFSENSGIGNGISVEETRA